MLVLDLVLVLDLILVRHTTIALACELIEAQNLVRQCLLPLTWVLLPALILVLASTLVPNLILAVAAALALACAIIEKSYRSGRPRAG
jgi:hypothetical protein